MSDEFNPMDIDLSDYKDPNDPAPEGVYKLEVQNAEWGESKKGDKMLKATMRIVDGEHAGKAIFENYMWVGGGARLGRWRAKQLLTLKGADLSNWTPEELVGLVFDARLKLNAGDDNFGPSNSIADIIG